MTDADKELFSRLMAHVARAEKLHPVFAEGVYQGLGRIGEEMGELAQSVNHCEPQERVDAEAMDLLTVVWRFVRKDYEMQEEQ